MCVYDYIVYLIIIIIILNTITVKIIVKSIDIILCELFINLILGTQCAEHNNTTIQTLTYN